jgi:hypothetical protein
LSLGSSSQEPPLYQTAAYNGIERMGRDYVHHAVNHSKEFVDEDGHHTNNMEASWRTIKMKVPSRK